MAGPVLQTLSDTLIPDAPEFKKNTDKPKVRSAKEASVNESNEMSVSPCKTLFKGLNL